MQEENKTQDNLNKNLLILNKFLLTNKNKQAMNLTMVHGLLYSIASSPCLIMPSDWTLVIFGGIPSFESIKHQKTVIDAVLFLYDHVRNCLSSGNENKLLLWIDQNKPVDFVKTTNNSVVNFCSGYIKGYFLDPILMDTFNNIPDISLAFILSLIQLGSSNKESINDEMKKALRRVMLENYNKWIDVRELNIAKTYFNDPLKLQNKKEKRA